MGDKVDQIDIGDDLDKYVDAILQNRGGTERMLVLQCEDDNTDDHIDGTPKSKVMAEVALRVVERVFGPPSEWNLWELTENQWHEFKCLFFCTEWMPCVACPVNLPQFKRYNTICDLEEGSVTIPGHFLWQCSDYDPNVHHIFCIPWVGDKNTVLLLWMVPVGGLCPQ